MKFSDITIEVKLHQMFKWPPKKIADLSKFAGYKKNFPQNIYNSPELISTILYKVLMWLDIFIIKILATRPGFAQVKFIYIKPFSILL